MTNLKPRDPARSDKSPVSNIKDLPPQQHSVFGRPFDTGEQASSFIGGVALESTRQIDRLIDDLNKLRQRLEDEGNRLQRDFADHSSFSKSVIQLTQIVSDSMAHVKGNSGAASTVTETHVPAFLAAIEQE